MTMHLRNSRDMMDNGEEESWWASKTGLEQKLIILSTLLFVLSFCLTISVIVLANRSKSVPNPPTPSLATSTGTEGTSKTESTSEPSEETSAAETEPSATTETQSDGTETESISTSIATESSEIPPATEPSEIPPATVTTKVSSKVSKKLKAEDTNNVLSDGIGDDGTQTEYKQAKMYHPLLRKQFGQVMIDGA